jgi:hypothetical protein
LDAAIEVNRDHFVVGCASCSAHAGAAAQLLTMMGSASSRVLQDLAAAYLCKSAAGQIQLRDAVALLNYVAGTQGIGQQEQQQQQKSLQNAIEGTAVDGFLLLQQQQHKEKKELQQSHTADSPAGAHVKLPPAAEPGICAFGSIDNRGNASSSCRGLKRAREQAVVLMSAQPQQGLTGNQQLTAATEQPAQSPGKLALWQRFTTTHAGDDEAVAGGVVLSTSQPMRCSSLAATMTASRATSQEVLCAQPAAADSPGLVHLAHTVNDTLKKWLLLLIEQQLDAWQKQQELIQHALQQEQRKIDDQDSSSQKQDVQQQQQQQGQHQQEQLSDIDRLQQQQQQQQQQLDRQQQVQLTDKDRLQQQEASIRAAEMPQQHQPQQHELSQQHLTEHGTGGLPHLGRAAEDVSDSAVEASVPADAHQSLNHVLQPPQPSRQLDVQHSMTAEDVDMGRAAGSSCNPRAAAAAVVQVLEIAERVQVHEESCASLQEDTGGGQGVLCQTSGQTCHQPAPAGASAARQPPLTAAVGQMAAAGTDEAVAARGCVCAANDLVLLPQAARTAGMQAEMQEDPADKCWSTSNLMTHISDTASRVVAKAMQGGSGAGDANKAALAGAGAGVCSGSGTVGAGVWSGSLPCLSQDAAGEAAAGASLASPPSASVQADGMIEIVRLQQRADGKGVAVIKTSWPAWHQLQQMPQGPSSSAQLPKLHNHHPQSSVQQVQQSWLKSTQPTCAVMFSAPHYMPHFSCEQSSRLLPQQQQERMAGVMMPVSHPGTLRQQMLPLQPHMTGQQWPTQQHQEQRLGLSEMSSISQLQALPEQAEMGVDVHAEFQTLPPSSAGPGSAAAAATDGMRVQEAAPAERSPGVLIMGPSADISHHTGHTEQQFHADSKQMRCSSHAKSGSQMPTSADDDQEPTARTDPAYLAALPLASRGVTAGAAHPQHPTAGIAGKMGARVTKLTQRPKQKQQKRHSTHASTSRLKYGRSEGKCVQDSELAADQAAADTDLVPAVAAGTGSESEDCSLGPTTTTAGAAAAAAAAEPQQQHAVMTSLLLQATPVCLSHTAVLSLTTDPLLRAALIEQPDLMAAARALLQHVCLYKQQQQQHETALTGAEGLIPQQFQLNNCIMEGMTDKDELLDLEGRGLICWDTLNRLTASFRSSRSSSVKHAHQLDLAEGWQEAVHDEGGSQSGSDEEEEDLISALELARQVPVTVVPPSQQKLNCGTHQHDDHISHYLLCVAPRTGVDAHCLQVVHSRLAVPQVMASS